MPAVHQFAQPCLLGSGAPVCASCVGAVSFWSGQILSASGQPRVPRATVRRPCRSLSASTGLISSATSSGAQPLQLSGNGGFRQSSAARLSCPFLQPLKLFSFSHSQPLQPYLSSSLSWRAQLDLSAHLQPHLSLGTWLVNLARSHLPSRDLPPSLLATSSKRGRQGSPSDLP